MSEVDFHREPGGHWQPLEKIKGWDISMKDLYPKCKYQIIHVSYPNSGITSTELIIRPQDKEHALIYLCH